MIDTKFARQEIIRRLQDGLRQEPKAGESFAEHINGVLDTAAAELRPEGLAEGEQADLDAFVGLLRPSTATTTAATYGRNLAKTVLLAYKGDVHRWLAQSLDLVFKAAISYDPTLEALKPPVPLSPALTPPKGYQDLLGLGAKVAPKSLLDRIFGNTFVIPS